MEGGCGSDGGMMIGLIGNQYCNNSSSSSSSSSSSTSSMVMMNLPPGSSSQRIRVPSSSNSMPLKDFNTQPHQPNLSNSYQHHNNTNQEEHLQGSCTDNNNNSDQAEDSVLKIKIMSHPHFPRLLSSYANCLKVGAPPEVVERLEEAIGEAGGGGGGGGGCMGEDPALDQFMEAYCEMLTKYEQELTKPLKEAMLFLSAIESQFKALTLSPPLLLSDWGDLVGGGNNTGSTSSEDHHHDGHEISCIDPRADDGELKGQLLRRYSGYLGSLKKEFMKKKKKGKLPKEARQMLLDWWTRHYKWPYPSESEKVALAEATGLDQKQINNWFINQRKRHWKPTEDMQLVVMDAASAAVAYPPLPPPPPHFYHTLESLSASEPPVMNPFFMDHFASNSHHHHHYHL